MCIVIIFGPIIDLENSKSDTCLLVPQPPTRIIITRPDDFGNAILENTESNVTENGDKTTTSPRSSSANNIYKMHQELEANPIPKRNSCSCRKCSLFDDCDPKEAKTVMKYLRFRKVLNLGAKIQLWKFSHSPALCLQVGLNDNTVFHLTLLVKEA